jgi:hypothetical protein
MTKAHYEHRSLDVACELEAGAAGAQRVEWRRLREDAGLGAEAIPGGARIWLRADAWEAADDLARREARCCGFLDMDVIVEENRVRLDITSPAVGAGPVISALAGIESDGAPDCC